MGLQSWYYTRLILLLSILAGACPAFAQAKYSPPPQHELTTRENFDPSLLSGQILSDTIQFREIFSNPDASMFAKLLHGAMVSGRNPEEELRSLLRDRSYYDEFRGRTLGLIYVICNNIYPHEKKWWERASNNLHIMTHERQIRQDILMKPGDKIDPDILMNNRQLLRSRRYITNINMLLVPHQEDTMVVDMYVFTSDKWTIGANVSSRGNGEANLKVYDYNILGTGNSLTLRTYINWKDKFHYGGNLAEYQLYNIWGSFFNVRLVAGKGFEQSDYGAEATKQFILPSDFAGGATFIRKQNYIDFRYPSDTLLNATWNTFDVWGGRSHFIPNLRNSLFITGRVNYMYYSQRPDVTERLNPYFHNHSRMLVQTGVYQERFHTTNRLYGYGINEYVPFGYRAALTTGYEWGEFSERWYLGGSLAGGSFIRAGYFGANFEVGGFFDDFKRRVSQGAVSLNFIFFSNLKGNVLYPARYFANLNVAYGINREEGYREMLGFTGDNKIRAMRTQAFGFNRLLLNTETVVFTPWHLYGFRIAAFSYVDVGSIGSDANLFKNDFYGSIGVGVRIKNEHMIFSTLTLRFGVALNKRGLVESQFFRMSSGDRVSIQRFIPQTPEIIDYY